MGIGECVWGRDLSVFSPRLNLISVSPILSITHLLSVVESAPMRLTFSFKVDSTLVAHERDICRSANHSEDLRTGKLSHQLFCVESALEIDRCNSLALIAYRLD